MEDPWAPIPDPFGALEPPRRNPPTAVGEATPPPPGGPKPQYIDRRTLRRRRLASAFAGSVLTASTVSLASVGSAWAVVLSAGTGVVAAFLFYRTARPVRRVGASPVLNPGTFRRHFRLKRRHAA